MDAQMDTRPVLERALEVLRREGAAGDAWLQTRRRVSYDYRDGRVETIQKAGSRGLAIRAMKDDRLGFCHTARTDPDGAAEAARRACELAAAASTRDDLSLAPASGPGDGRDEGAALGCADPAIAALSVEDRMEALARVEKAALGYDRKIRRSNGASWNENESAVWIANTNGLFRHYGSTGLSVGASVIAEEDGEMQPGDHSWSGVRLADRPEPEAIGRRAGELAVRLLGGAPVETGRYPLVFSPDAGWTLLIYLSVALNGSHLSRGRSWLAALREQTNEPQIGSPLVTVRDEGRHLRAPGRVPFDGEGVDTRNIELVTEGRVTGTLCDLAAGSRLGTGSTGSSNRDGYEALPGIGVHNLYLQPGAATPEEILAGVDRGLWIWGMSGWWIGLDPTNDRFSSAVSGLWIEKGKPVRPVARVTVSGSIPELLGAVDAVGNDLVWDGGVKTPTFRLREATVSGT